ncbi:MAG: hypothetical protein Q4D06_02125 [Coriobacteriia bacterium]|nr:hypothetical protein [Coriobacteriia bacterium]
MAAKIDIKNLQLTPGDLGGLDLADITCRACSGYGNCGYRMYRLNEGKPVLICQQMKEKLLEEKEK